MTGSFPIHARTHTGLEGILAEELRELGAQEIELGSRVVRFTGNQELLYRANLWCRTAIRVLVPVASFGCSNEKAFYEGIRNIEWERWLKPHGTFAFDTGAYRSFSSHTLYLSQLAKDAVVDRARDRTGQRPSVDLLAPDLKAAIHLFENTALVLVDASGPSLHRRGYRLAPGAAPLKETLAAGVLKLGGWTPEQPLVDPMCGSGTFSIEAALMATHTAPGLLRESFGYQSWPGYDRDLHTRLIDEAKAKVQVKQSLPIWAFDSNPAAVESARQNMERAGVRGLCRLEQADFFTWNEIPPKAGAVVLNPPYGERIGVKDAALFYRQIGDRLKSAYPHWNAILLSGNLEATKSIGLRSKSRTAVFNGSLECRVMVFPIGAVGRQTPTRPKWHADPPGILPEWKPMGEVFINRIRKNYKHLSKWARREKINYWRVYDCDTVEVPVQVDILGDWVCLVEIPRNHQRNPAQNQRYFTWLGHQAALAMGMDPEKCVIHLHGQPPVEWAGPRADPVEINEGGASIYLDPLLPRQRGLAPEDRLLRAWVEEQTPDKRRTTFNLPSDPNELVAELNDLDASTQAVVRVRTGPPLPGQPATAPSERPEWLPQTFQWKDVTAQLTDQDFKRTKPCRYWLIARSG